MDFKNVKVRTEQAVGFVQIDRVVDKNSLNIETSKEILQALTNFDQDSSIKCIAIEGNQKLFSPGADIKELQSLNKNAAAEKKLFDAFDEIYNIKTRIEEQIGFVQIDRVADKNSLNIETSKEILQALTNFDQDSSIKCIAIEGNQKLFSPGADIKELQSLNKNTAAEKKLFDAFDEIYNIKKPVVALVEGYALGGGMELALICDFIIASENAKFSQPEVNLGLIPGIGGTQRLKRSAGKYNANFLCMTGEMVTAQQAQNMGIVSVVLKAGEFKDGTMKILKSISEKPLSSLIEIKRLINKDASLKDERQTFYKLLDSENKKIGIKSFFEKTKPEWK